MEVKRLRYWREQRALSQRDLAERVSIPHSTIARIEMRGTARPSTIRKLAEALGVTPAQLMGEDQPDQGHDKAAA